MKSEYPTRHADQHLPAGSDPIPGLFEVGRVVYGAVLNDGNTLDDGSADWTCTWDSGHTYTIDISPPLDGPPVAYGLTPNNNNPPETDGRYIVSILDRESDGSQVTVITQDADDPDSLTPQDGGFDFAFVAGIGLS